MLKNSIRFGRMLMLSAAPLLGMALMAPGAAQTVPMDSTFTSTTAPYDSTPGETLLAVDDTTVNREIFATGPLSIDASTYVVNFAQPVYGGSAFGNNPLTIESSSPGNGEIVLENLLNAVTLNVNQTTLQITSNSLTTTINDSGTLIASLSNGGSPSTVYLNGAGAFQLVAASPGGSFLVYNASGFTGTTSIGAGTTLVVYTPMVGNVVDNGSLTLGSKNYIGGTYTSTISGSGSVAIGGPITFATNQTYTGGTEVLAGGGLQLGIGGTTGSVVGNIVVDQNGLLIFDQSGTYVVSNNITAPGLIQIEGTGTLVLTGNDYFGFNNPQSKIISGTLQVGNGGTTGSLSGYIEDDSVLVFDHSDTIYSPILSGTGEVIQAGTGTVIVDGPNSVGEVLVSTGTLVVGDAATPSTVLAAPVTVQPGAALEGYGTISGAVQNSGTVMPGNGLGTLTVGSYAQTSTGKLAVSVAPGSVGLLNVTGNASLNGALDVNLSPSIGAGEYTFLDAGSITGRFTSVVTTDPPVLTGLYYTPTSVSLIVAPIAGTQLAGAFLRNTLDIAENLDDRIFAHLDNQTCRESELGQGNLPACPKFSVWHQIFGGAGAIDGAGDLNAVDSRWAGFAGGIDVDTDLGFWLGLSGSYERNELNIAGDNGKIGSNVFSMTLTGGLPLLWGRLDGMASFHRNDGDSGRGLTVEANPKDTLWDAAVQYEQSLLGDQLSGFARLTYTSLDAGSYAESSGAPFNFQYGSNSYSTGYGDLGLHYSDTFALNSGTQVIPEASVGVRAIIGNTLPNLQAQLASVQSATSVIVPALDRDRVAFKANVGVTARDRGLSYYLRLDGLISGNQREGALMIGVASDF